MDNYEKLTKKLKIEFGIALTINKEFFRNCTHSTFGIALTRIRIALTEKWSKPFSTSRYSASLKVL